MWREALGCWKIITENKKGYRNHPATKEFEGKPRALWYRLAQIRTEMVFRGYHPKNLPTPSWQSGVRVVEDAVVPWQTFEEQLAWLKTKKCKCNI